MRTKNGRSKKYGREHSDWDRGKETGTKRQMEQPISISLRMCWFQCRAGKRLEIPVSLLQRRWR